MTKKRIRLEGNEADQMVDRTDTNSTISTCISCGEVKPLAEFAVDRSRTSGHRSMCAFCRRSYDWARNYLRRSHLYGKDPVLQYFSRAQLVTRHGDCCYVCRGPWDQLDHVVPVRAGGRHDLENCRPICAECNRFKYRWVDWAVIAVLDKNPLPSHGGEVGS